MVLLISVILSCLLYFSSIGVVFENLILLNDQVNFFMWLVKCSFMVWSGLCLLGFLKWFFKFVYVRIFFLLF